MMRYSIIKLLFFALLAYTQIVLAESNDEKCREILGSIIQDTELMNQDKLNKWANYEHTCSKDYVYYLGQACIYGLQDTGLGVNHLNKLLKEGKIAYTKEILFFLGTGYDSAYFFQKDRETLRALNTIADILMHDYKNSATGFFLKGCYFFHRNKIDKAQEYYEKAEELGEDGDDNSALTSAIKILIIKRAVMVAYGQDRFNLSIALYNKACELDEFSTVPYWTLLLLTQQLEH